MQIKRRLSIPLAFSCALAVPVSPNGSHPSVPATTDRGWSELTSSMDKMHDAMSSVTPTGDTDADFVRLMLPHHQAAVDMAKTEQLLGKSREMQRLAQEIIADQQSEIELMELWLKKHGQGRRKAGESSGPSVKEN